MNTINISLTMLVFFVGMNAAAYVVGDVWHIPQLQSFAPLSQDQVRAQAVGLNSTYVTQSQNLDAFAFLANAIYSNNVIGPFLFLTGGGIALPMLMSLGLHPMLVATLNFFITGFVIYAVVFIVRGMKS